MAKSFRGCKYNISKEKIRQFGKELFADFQLIITDLGAFGTG